MRDHFIAGLTKLAEQDGRIMIVTGDLGFGVLTNFADQLPNQFINAGVAEQNMTGMATGLALEGRVVFTYSIGNFSTLRCLEQIRNDACYHGVNVNVVSIGGGFSYGALGISHHATEDLAIMRALPDITVLSPSCDWEAEQCARTLVDTPGVGYLRLDKSSPGNTGRSSEVFELGKARTLSEGSDVTLLTAGGILEEVLAAAKILGEREIHARVLSMHTVKPLDGNAVLKAARETGGIVTVEEHTVSGGLGGAVAEVLLEEGVMPRFFHRVGLRAGFSSIVGSQKYLRKRYGLDAETIVKQVLSCMSRR